MFLGTFLHSLFQSPAKFSQNGFNFANHQEGIVSCICFSPPREGTLGAVPSMPTRWHRHNSLWPGMPGPLPSPSSLPQACASRSESRGTPCSLPVLPGTGQLRRMVPPTSQPHCQAYASTEDQVHISLEGPYCFYLKWNLLITKN